MATKTCKDSPLVEKSNFLKRTLLWIWRNEKWTTYEEKFAMITLKKDMINSVGVHVSHSIF